MFSEHQLKSMEACGEVIKQSRRMSMTAPVDDDFPEVKHDFDNAVLTYAALLRPTPAPVKVACQFGCTTQAEHDAHFAAPVPVPAAERELVESTTTIYDQGKALALATGYVGDTEAKIFGDGYAEGWLSARALRGTVDEGTVETGACQIVERWKYVEQPYKYCLTHNRRESECCAALTAALGGKE